MRRNWSHNQFLVRLCELAPKRHRPEPDWALVHGELKKKHVTKLLVWQEYREGCAEGLSYSQFCARYLRYRDSLGLVARRDHRAGERMFVDFSGDGINIIDAITGEVNVAKLFVAVLGASNLTYVEPVLHEDLPTWIQCHINAWNLRNSCSAAGKSPLAYSAIPSKATACVRWMDSCAPIRSSVCRAYRFVLAISPNANERYARAAAIEAGSV